MRYFDELKRAMNYLAAMGVYFMGQTVEYDGSACFRTLTDVPKNLKMETPVFEESQLGISLGMAIHGMTICSIFPRMNFLLLAINQLVNHIDKTYVMSGGVFNPHIIIRTSIGADCEKDPQEQHKGDFTEALKLMCPNIYIERLEETERIFPAYVEAYERKGPSLLIEVGNYYSQK